MSISNPSLSASSSKFSGSKRLFLSSFMSAGLMLLLIAVLLAAQYLPDMAEPELEIRAIAASVPPPPPPPKQPQVEQKQEITLDLAAEGNGAVLPDIEVPEKIEVTKPDMPEITMDEVSIAEFTPDIDIFNLNQLDSLPSLITKARIVMPESLKMRGVRQVRLRLDVTISTNGKVTLNRVVENPYVEFDKEIQRLIRRSKFTPPKRDGEIVNARFIWPIDISV